MVTLAVPSAATIAAGLMISAFAPEAENTFGSAAVKTSPL